MKKGQRRMKQIFSLMFPFQLLVLLHPHHTFAQLSTASTPSIFSTPASCTSDSDCTITSNATHESTGSCIEKRCVCKAPWGGTHCRTCTCENDGKCEFSPWSDQFACECTANFTGPLCKQCSPTYKPKKKE
jgi:hypothetical protein